MTDRQPEGSNDHRHPFRVGVASLTMEPLDKLVNRGRLLDRLGFDTFWLCEAYPWWRRYSREARSVTAITPTLLRETERITIGWGILASYARHPLQVALDIRAAQDAGAPGRLIAGLGASKMFMEEIGEGERAPAKPRTNVVEALKIIQGHLKGEPFEFEGDQWTARVPGLTEETEAPRWSVPIYIGATGPRMTEAAGELADGLLTPSITTPAFLPYSREHLAKGAEKAGRNVDEIDVGSTLISSIDEDCDRGRAGARELLGYYLSNKVQNIKASADVLLETAGLTRADIAPIAEAVARDGAKGAREVVTDEIMEKCKVIAGSPEEVRNRLEEYRRAGCRHTMLLFWGDDREKQIELFADQVLPHFRDTSAESSETLNAAAND
ncbi:MAG: LLM class flavin-dependent oxidoreductase [Solirubrobacterales bacterium]